MAVIHIDGTTVEVDSADNLLQACLSLGIDVPYFCYHPALGSAGACRQCAVKQYQNKEDMEAGRGRLVMSCMVAPGDDMYISVTDDEAKAFRKSMVELLMSCSLNDIFANRLRNFLIKLRTEIFNCTHQWFHSTRGVRAKGFTDP